MYDEQINTKSEWLAGIIKLLPPGSAIAGGYLRDLLTGRTPKDMDILVDQGMSLSDLEALEQYLGMGRVYINEGFYESFRRDETDGVGYEGEDPGRDRMSVLYEAEKDGFSYDILVVPDVTRYVEQFPDNISRVMFDEDGLSMYPDFVSGHAEQRIIYRVTGETARLEKLQSYYPSYSTRFSV